MENMRRSGRSSMKPRTSTLRNLFGLPIVHAHLGGPSFAVSANFTTIATSRSYGSFTYHPLRELRFRERQSVRFSVPLVPTFVCHSGLMPRYEMTRWSKRFRSSVTLLLRPASALSFDSAKHRRHGKRKNSFILCYKQLQFATFYF